MKKKLSIIWVVFIFLMSFASYIEAADWYVRPITNPPGSTYGTGDGTSYENAFQLGPTVPFIPNNGYGNANTLYPGYPMPDTPVIFGPSTNSTTPGNITLGATYYLKTTSTMGVYELSTTPGGSTVDITSNGAGIYMWINDFTVASVAYFSATSNTITLQDPPFGYGNDFDQVPIFIWTTGTLPKKADGNRLTSGKYYIVGNHTNYNLTFSQTKGGSPIELDSSDIGTGVHYISYIDWNAIQPGDTVHICGRYIDWTWSQPINSFCVLNYIKSGTVGNPITVKGESGNQITGASYNLPITGWTQHATVSQVYYRTNSTGTIIGERSTNTEDWKFLNLLPRYVSDPAKSNELSQFLPGDWGRNSANVLYVRPLSSNNADANSNYYSLIPDNATSVRRSSNININNLNLIGSTLSIEQADNITIDGITSKGTGINIYGQCDNLTIKNSAFNEFSDCIYLNDALIRESIIPAGRLKYTTNANIYNNTFTKTFQRGGMIITSDYHAIGIQNAVGVNVYGNKFYNVGTACTYYSDGTVNGDINMYNNFVNGVWRMNSKQNIIYIIPGNPTKIVAWGHGFTNGQTVVIEGITQANWLNLNGSFMVANKTSDTFTVAFDSSGYSDDYAPDVDPGTVKILDAGLLSYANGAGLDLHGTNPSNTTYSIYNNIILNVDGIGIRAGLTGNSGTHKILNNTIYKSAVPISFGYNMTTAPQNVTMKNNIIHTPYDWGSGLPLCFMYAGANYDPTAWTVDINNNDYYPSVDTGNKFYWVYGGAGLISYATWKTKTFSGSLRPDVTSLTIDPLFKNTSGLFNIASDFKIMSHKVGQGGALVGVKTDYFGNSIVGTPSIGAHQLQGLWMR